MGGMYGAVGTALGKGFRAVNQTQDRLHGGGVIFIIRIFMEMGGMLL